MDMKSENTVPVKKFRSVRNRYTPFQAILFYGTILIFALFALIPFWILISASLSNTDLIKYDGVGFFPKGFT